MKDRGAPPVYRQAPSAGPSPRVAASDEGHSEQRNELQLRTGPPSATR